MWKYVSRRLRETLDRAYNIVDIRKNWSCGVQQTTGSSSDNENSGKEAVKARCHLSNCAGFKLIRCLSESGSSKSGGQGGNNRRRVRDGDETLQQDLLGAITWSGAIICGWYASQLLCLHRRQYGWENKNQVSKILNIPSRAFHSNVRSYFVFASPVQPSGLTEKALKENFSLADVVGHNSSKRPVFNINNTTESSSCIESESSSQETSKRQSIDDAVADLVGYLGETEYKMGLQSLAAKDYSRAVLHLKLATSNNHARATFNLGLCYEKGLGVRKNLNRAMECYQIASRMGHSKAIFNLGVFYAQGLGGLQKDYAAARQCFITAAELGQPEAKYVLQLNPLGNDSNSVDAGGSVLNRNHIDNVHNFSTIAV